MNDKELLDYVLDFAKDRRAANKNELRLYPEHDYNKGFCEGCEASYWNIIELIETFRKKEDKK